MRAVSLVATSHPARFGLTAHNAAPRPRDQGGFKVYGAQRSRCLAPRSGFQVSQPRHQGRFPPRPSWRASAQRARPCGSDFLATKPRRTPTSPLKAGFCSQSSPLRIGFPTYLVGEGRCSAPPSLPIWEFQGCRPKPKRAPQESHFRTSLCGSPRASTLKPNVLLRSHVLGPSY